MDEYPSNSFKASAPKEVEESKKIEKVIEGAVIRRKKPVGKRFLENFIGSDIKTVGSYVMFEVLLPAAKDTLADAMSQGVERMLFGEARSTSRRTGRRPGQQDGGFVNYHRMSGRDSSYGRREDSRDRRDSPRRRGSHNFDEIILATRVEAEEVIDRLFELISRYDSVTVADLYELVGEEGTYTNRAWGWTDLRGAGVTRIRNGYLLDLPRPEPLD